MTNEITIEAIDRKVDLLCQLIVAMATDDGSTNGMSRYSFEQHMKRAKAYLAEEPSPPLSEVMSLLNTELMDIGRKISI